MKKNIVFFHLFNNFSGSAKVLNEVIALIKKDNNVTLITSDTNGFLSNLSIKTKLIHYFWSVNKFLLLFRFLKAQVYLIIYALSFKDKNTIFYINTHQPSVVGLIGKLTGKKVIFHLHERSKSQKYIGELYRLIRKIVKGQEIFVSEYLKKNEKINLIKSKVIYNTISQNILKNTKEVDYSPFRNDIFNVVMICSLKDYKGIPEFLDICQLLETEEHILFTLIVDANKTDIGKYFTNFLLPNNINIQPRTQSPEQFIKVASLLLNLSRVDECVETFGLTILEAMTYGVPCIVPPVGGPTELIDDSVNGYYISCYDTQKIVQTILKLKNDPNLCHFLSIKAKKKSENFGPAIFKNEILKFISNI